MMSANCENESSSSNHTAENCLTPKKPEYKSPMAKASSYQPSPAASHSLLRNAQRGLQNSSSSKGTGSSGQATVSKSILKTRTVNEI